MHSMKNTILKRATLRQKAHLHWISSAKHCANR